MSAASLGSPRGAYRPNTGGRSLGKCCSISVPACIAFVSGPYWRKASSSASDRAPSDSSSAFWLVKNWCAEPTRIPSTRANRRLRRPHSRADHVTRAHQLVALGETPLKMKAHPHAEGEETDRHGNNDVLHVLAQSLCHHSSQPAGISFIKSAQTATAGTAAEARSQTSTSSPWLRSASCATFLDICA